MDSKHIRWEVGASQMSEALVSEPTPAASDRVQVLAAQPKRPKAFNSLQIAPAQFDKVAEHLGLDPASGVNRRWLRAPFTSSDSFPRKASMTAAFMCASKSVWLRQIPYRKYLSLFEAD